MKEDIDKAIEAAQQKTNEALLYSIREIHAFRNLLMARLEQHKKDLKNYDCNKECALYFTVKGKEVEADLALYELEQRFDFLKQTREAEERLKKFKGLSVEEIRGIVMI